MKRYLAFAYPDYYPSGGAEDFVGDFDDLSDAKSAAYRAMCEHGWGADDNKVEGAGANVLDLETCQRVKWRGNSTLWRQDEQWVELK